MSCPFTRTLWGEVMHGGKEGRLTEREGRVWTGLDERGEGKGRVGRVRMG